MRSLAMMLNEISSAYFDLGQYNSVAKSFSNDIPNSKRYKIITRLRRALSSLLYLSYYNFQK